MRKAPWTLAVLLFAGCLTASPQADRVRVTSNPEIVRGCQFLGNVRATSGWGNAGGIAGHNTDVAMREKAAKLGADTVLVTVSGAHAVGEAYRCAGSARS